MPSGALQQTCRLCDPSGWTAYVPVRLLQPECDAELAREYPEVHSALFGVQDDLEKAAVTEANGACLRFGRSVHIAEAGREDTTSAQARRDEGGFKENGVYFVLPGRRLREIMITASVLTLCLSHLQL